MKYAVCYNGLYVFENDNELRKFFSEGIIMSEGAERDRYVSVMINSAIHQKISEDFVSEYCRSIVIKTNKYYDNCLIIDLDARKSFDDTVNYYEKIVQPILKVSEDYNVDFNRDIPFEDFDNDTVACCGTMYSFSDYYKDILEKFDINVTDIYTEDKSDGKYKITINDNYSFDTTAWDKINNVIDNVESMIETLKENESEMIYE